MLPQPALNSHRRHLAAADWLLCVVGTFSLLFFPIAQASMQIEVITKSPQKSQSPSLDLIPLELTPAMPQSTMKSSYRSGKVPTGEQGMRQCKLVVALLTCRCTATQSPDCHHTWHLSICENTFLDTSGTMSVSPSLPLSLLCHSPNFQAFLQHSWPPFEPMSYSHPNGSVGHFAAHHDEWQWWQWQWPLHNDPNDLISLTENQEAHIQCISALVIPVADCPLPSRSKSKPALLGPDLLPCARLPCPDLHSSPNIGQSMCPKVSRECADATPITTLLTHLQTEKFIMSGA